MAKRLFSKPIRVKEERNGPPSANHARASTTKPRSSHTIWAQLLKPAQLPLSHPFC